MLLFYVLVNNYDFNIGKWRQEILSVDGYYEICFKI